MKTPLFFTALLSSVLASISASRANQTPPQSTLSAFFDRATTPPIAFDSLLQGAASSNVIALDTRASGPRQSIRAAWKMRLEGSEGAALVLRDVRKLPSDTTLKQFQNWDEPNLAGTFCIAFDASNPPADNPFDARGNIYDRPQREISLHWNGLEIANRVSPREFRGQWHSVGVALDFVVGGALVSVSVDGLATYQKYFVAGLQPFQCRASLGATAKKELLKGEMARCDIGEIRLDYGRPTNVVAPLSIRALERRVVKLNVARQESMIDFPKNNDEFGRIILRLSLTEPPGGFDPWDRRAAIYLYDKSGGRFELLRFITPYHRGYSWRVDVSDFRPLLRGRQKIEAWCETYGAGYEVSVDFDFYRGPAAWKAYKVENLWVGDPEIGNIEKPASNFWTPRTLNRDLADALKLRFTATGHGMTPNAQNAAEFMPSLRTVSLGDAQWQNNLWKTDNYLNPCRPQGGTWKYDRAGWGPGDIVLPWEIEVSSTLSRNHSATLRYEIAPYLNATRRDDFPPSHWFESQAIYYRKAR